MRKRSSPVTLLLLALVVFLAFKLWEARHPLAAPPQRSAERAFPEDRALRPRARERERRPYTSSGWAERGDGDQPSCDALGVTCTSEYLAQWREPEDGACAVRNRPGSYPLPDARCTPGGINPSVTEGVLRDPRWRTRCTRNCQVDEADKHAAYAWYGIARPRRNEGENQVCELDHLVPLELGGADGLGNIWPECGPDEAALPERYFKIKDRVESYLADEVRAGRMPLAEAQHGIASDWTRYLPAANQYCAAGGRCE